MSATAKVCDQIKNTRTRAAGPLRWKGAVYLKQSMAPRLAPKEKKT